MELTAQALNAQRIKVAELRAIRDDAIAAHTALVDGGTTLCSHTAKLVANACYHVHKERAVLADMMAARIENKFPEKSYICPECRRVPCACAFKHY